MLGKLLWAELVVTSSNPGTSYIDVDWDSTALAAKVGGEYLIPRFLTVDEGADSFLRIKELWLATVDTDQKLYDLIPSTGAGAGKGVTLAMLNKQYSPLGSGFTAGPFKVRHGLRIKVKCEETGGAQRTVNLLLSYENNNVAAAGAPGQQFFPPGLGAVPPGQLRNPGYGAWKFAKF